MVIPHPAFVYQCVHRVLKAVIPTAAPVDADFLSIYSALKNSGNVRSLSLESFSHDVGATQVRFGSWRDAAGRMFKGGDSHRRLRK